MPARRAAIGTNDVFSRVRQRNKPSPRDLVGVEVEWLTLVAASSRSRPPSALLAQVARTELPAGSSITLEPGGQIELSTLPAPNIDLACDAFQTDALALRDACQAAGLALAGLGLEPSRSPDRTVDTPRYAAMGAYFDALGNEGNLMMTSTAGIQVNVDLGGTPEEAKARWAAAHEVGPVLAGAFANSSVARDIPSGWRTKRLANWFALDPDRTRPVGGDDLANAWAEYALRAPVMLIRQNGERLVALDRRFTFRQWIEQGHPLGYPTLDDLEYHMTTLFPPVRPRGWLELRMIDALPLDEARAAIAVTTILLTDANAREQALAAARGARIEWQDACRFGLQHPAIGRAARACFTAAREALVRSKVSTTTLDAVARYEEKFVAVGRTPADDFLERWMRSRAIEPALERLEFAWT